MVESPSSFLNSIISSVEIFLNIPSVEQHFMSSNEGNSLEKRCLRPTIIIMTKNANLGFSNKQCGPPNSIYIFRYVQYIVLYCYHLFFQSRLSESGATPCSSAYVVDRLASRDLIKQNDLRAIPLSIFAVVGQALYKVIGERLLLCSIKCSLASAADPVHMYVHK